MTSVWQLTQDTLGPDDAKWIIGLGCRVTMRQEPIVINTSYGTVQVAGHSHISVYTETDKQVNMLRLKYGDNLRLHSIHA